jgi:hypothetical protein
MTHRLLFFFKALKGGRSLKIFNNNKAHTRASWLFSRNSGTLNLPNPRDWAFFSFLSNIIAFFFLFFNFWLIIN